MENITIKTPARICLFGDHQDYLELPVIACAIDRYITLTAQLNTTNSFNIKLPDINEAKTIKINDVSSRLKEGEYFRSAMRVLTRHGNILNKGYDVSISGNIPINAGVSSSSAIIVAWIHFLLVASGRIDEISTEVIAQLAYEAEVVEFDSPGGKMDQFTISIGDLIYIDTKHSKFNKINTSLEGIILAESGIGKETLELLANRREFTQEAIASVSDRVTDFNLAAVTMEVLDSYIYMIPNHLQPYFIAAIKNHSITQKAHSILNQTPLNIRELGKLMNNHHEVLRDLLKVTVPRIDKMIQAAQGAGAYGAKIVGSGGGGCIVALVPESATQAILDALIENGATAAYQINISEGTKII